MLASSAGIPPYIGGGKMILASPLTLESLMKLVSGAIGARVLV